MNKNGIFTITGWDEYDLKQVSSPLKVRRATVTRSLSGFLRGEEKMEYCLVYSRKDHSEFTGTGTFVGTIGEATGTFAVLELGCYEDGRITSQFELHPLDDGGQKLDVLIGTGSYVAGDDCSMEYQIEFK